jgi:hypothetical protein
MKECYRKCPSERTAQRQVYSLRAVERAMERGKSTRSDGMAIEESSDFCRKNFVQAANVLAKSMKNKRFCEFAPVGVH